MKNKAFILLLSTFILSALGCRAQNVVFTWSPPATGSPTGYKLYVSPPGTTNWNVLATVTSTNHTVPFIATAWGERYFVTSTRDTQESPPSAVITNQIPRSPENFRLIHNIALPQ